MSAQSIYNLSDGTFCQKVDEHLACMGNSYLMYEEYKVGSPVSIDAMMEIAYASKILCSGRMNCLCPEDVERLLEKINKKIINNV